MPCGKKPLVKSWEHPRNIRVVKPSRYEQNEASVKAHWQNVLRNLELSYKDEKFWESSAGQVRELVGPEIFSRIAKIFDLPKTEEVYQPQSETVSPMPSCAFYKIKIEEKDFTDSELQEEEVKEEQSQEESFEDEEISQSTPTSSSAKNVLSKLISKSKSQILSKSFIKSAVTMSNKSALKMISRSRMKSILTVTTSEQETATTNDDIEVHVGLKAKRANKRLPGGKNPFFDMLYCKESETDMITWPSKYKQKGFEVSASDEFSKKAEIMTKKIAKEFYEWWVQLGNLEFKSEIRRPEDIEELFQVWFDEHASRSLVIDPKIMPCVLQSIADYVELPKVSCMKVLARQVAFDIKAETSPAHVEAFGTCLPQKMKHIPPNNNTKELWKPVSIPEDLKTMSCVFGEIDHLTSTKSFRDWLRGRPHLPMPPCLRSLGLEGEKKSQFIVPSDFVLRDQNSSVSLDLALPVSQFSMELTDVLSKLMNQ